MKRQPLLLALLLLAAAGAGLVLARHRLEAASSTLSRGGTGWLAARLYLAQRGGAPVTLDRPPEEGTLGHGTLVVAFPRQTRALEDDSELVRAHLAADGDVVLAYSGETVPTAAERSLLEAVGVRFELLPIPPLAPWHWRAVAARPWRLRAAPRWRSASAAGAIDLELRRPRWLPDLPRDGALLMGPGDRVVMAAWRLRHGRVVVLPAELLCNARLAGGAHAALLETLRGWLAGPWRFDEYHHGLGSSDGNESAPVAVRRGFDRLLLQLLLIYLVAVLALSRRLGPPWRETPLLAGSAGGFLLRLGALHHRLGHHGEGAVLLLRRAAELDRRLTIGDDLRALATRDDAASLVAVGQAVARMQRLLGWRGRTEGSVR